MLGKGYGEPVAMEGALKLKEMSYIHAEGYSGGALKHGPFALIDGEDVSFVAEFRVCSLVVMMLMVVVFFLVLFFREPNPIQPNPIQPQPQHTRRRYDDGNDDPRGQRVLRR